jgi:hypothetical protein
VSWSSTQAPTPGSASSMTLKAISCAKSYGCVAIGSYSPSTETVDGVLVMTAP